jgi:two-component system sensor histidine kinase AlgZ
MILQPLVENAIRHGIAAIRSGGALDLATACRGGRLEIRIANDGPAAAAAGEPRAAGIGLQNARARLRQLYGDAGRLRLVSRPQGGAELLMELPLRGVAGYAEGAA